MSNCPLCLEQVEITDRHYGALYTCPRCAGIFFVSWDGTPEVSSQESENLFSNVPNEEAPAVDYSSQNFAEAPSSHFSNQAMEAGFASPVGDLNYFGGELALESQPSVGFDSSTSGGFDNPPSEFTNIEPVTESSFSASSEEVSSFSNELPPNSMMANSDLSDIADFGNSEARPGGVSYTLEISGIDSGRLSVLVLEALTDSRFGWDAKEVFKNVKSGTLSISNLNTAKAFVLIERLQPIEVVLRWRQDVFE